MTTLVQDLRHTVRMIARSPGFSAVVVLTLALGIGSNTAVVSVVNAVLLRPLPYKDPARLVIVWETDRKRGVERNAVAPANFLDWCDQSQAFEQIASVEISQGFNLTNISEAERIEGVRATATLFPLLGVDPLLGRTFSQTEDQVSSPPVVLLSHGFWQRRFGADPGIIGQILILDGRSYSVVGVMPAHFSFPEHLRIGGLSVGFAASSAKAPDVWVPMAFHDNERWTRGIHYLAVVARLKPDLSVEQAEVELNAIQSRIAQNKPGDYTSAGVSLVPLQEQLVGKTRLALLLLMGAVGFVLLVACINVANLLLARSAARQKEIAIRTALGAKRSLLLRQLLTESALLAVMGGAVGLIFARWGVDMFLGISGENLPIPEAQQIGLDARVLAFTFALSLATGLLFGLAPALGMLNTDLNEPLKEGGRTSTASLGGRRFRHLLVISEVSLALVLLSGAGLMIRSFLHLTQDHPGFDSENLLTMRIWLPSVNYPDYHQRAGFYRSLFDRVTGLPGVQSAGAVHLLPVVGGRHHVNFTIEGRPPVEPGNETGAQFRVITPGYFRTMHIPLRKGREFIEGDAQDQPRVAVINEAMARRYWPDEDPIGKRLKPEAVGSSPWISIVGIVADVKEVGLAVPPEPAMYVSYFQHPSRLISLVVRTKSEPLRLAAALRSEIQAIDRGSPVFEIRTMEQILSDSVWRSRFTTLLLAVFAFAALLLAAVGLYGVVSSSVSQRRNEIGIRMALGATRGDVLRLVLGQGLSLVLAGVAIGLVAAWALMRLMASLLYGITARDPLTFGGVSLLLVLVAALAIYFPARRATKVDPMVALRYE